jgi:hypothetical protein
MSSPLRQTLTDLLATLRAIRWHSWVTHWKAQGGDAYSDHLLFQRIYSGEGGGPKIDDQIDGLGERVIALFGNAAIDGATVAEKATRIHRSIKGLGRIAGALKLEQSALQEAASAADLVAKGSPALRIGLDNFVRELADARSTVIYLLQQRLKGGSDSYGGLKPGSTAASVIPLAPYALGGALLGAAVANYGLPGRVTPGRGAQAGALAGLGLGLFWLRTAPVEVQVPESEVATANNVLEFTPASAPPDNVVRLSDHPDFGTLVDAEVESDFHASGAGPLSRSSVKGGHVLGCLVLAGVAYVAWWDSKRPRGSL